MKRTVVVNVPNRSTHSLSHWVRGTARCGTLVPVVCEELMGGTKFNLKTFLDVQMAPCAAMPLLSADVHLEAFAVPHRLLYRNFTSWITGEQITGLYGNPPSIQSGYAQMPYIDLNFVQSSHDQNVAADAQRKYLCASSLLDYLGCQIDPSLLDTQDVRFPLTPFPMLAYHRIFDEWYRNPKIQKSVFINNTHHQAFSNTNYFFATDMSSVLLSSAPYSVSALQLNYSSGFDKFRLADDVNLFALRQRSFGFDRFTNATLAAQLGSAQSVSTSGASFTISSLRVANSLQLFLERSSLSGYRWQDYLHAHNGTSLPSGIAQRSIYLGRSIVNLDTIGVQTTADTSPSTARNPYNGLVGNRIGNVFATADGQIVDEVEFAEPVYIVIMMSLVPRVAYCSGIDSQLQRYTTNGSVVDLADPLLQNTGNEAIYKRELMYNPGNDDRTIFGYSERYSRYMESRDRVCGAMRDDSTLKAFALSRSFADSSSFDLSTNFLKIPVGYMDQVLSMNTDGEEPNQYGYQFNFHCDFPVSHPLYASSIPSLQDPAIEHGKHVNVNTYTSL